MIGKRSEAEAVFKGHTPDGFKRLSGGGNRNVYANDEVCYKVQTYFGRYMRGFGNAAEYKHARVLRNRSDKGWIGRVYIPETSAYSFGSKEGFIIAMERIHGEPAQWGQSGLGKAQQSALWQLFNLGFGDMHAGNYMWLSGHKVAVAPVDMGSQRYTKNIVENADSRVLSGTALSQKVSKHRDWWWRNKDRQPHVDARGRVRVAPTCPCGCGAVAWYA